MKKLIPLVGILLLVVACGKDPAPVPPVPPVPPTPPTTFTVTGKSIVVQGTMKAGTTVPTGYAEAAVKAAVRMLETKKSEF